MQEEETEAEMEGVQRGTVAQSRQKMHKRGVQKYKRGLLFFRNLPAHIETEINEWSGAKQEAEGVKMANEVVTGRW